MKSISICLALNVISFIPYGNTNVSVMLQIRKWFKKGKWPGVTEPVRGRKRTLNRVFYLLNTLQTAILKSKQKKSKHKASVNFFLLLTWKRIYNTTLVLKSVNGGQRLKLASCSCWRSSTQHQRWQTSWDSVPVDIGGPQKILMWGQGYKFLLVKVFLPLSVPSFSKWNTSDP